MDIQNTLQDLKSNFTLNPSILSLYFSLAEAQKTIMAQKALEQQIRFFAPTQSFIPPKDQLVMQARINSLSAYLDTARNFGSTSGLAKLPDLQIQKEGSIDCEKLKLKNEDSKLSLETTDSDCQRSDVASRDDKESCSKIKVRNLKNKTQQSLDSKKRRNYWLPHEDKVLMNLIGLHGQKWTKIASCLENRTGKQVRDRYLNYLKPSIKQRGWTVEEDELLHKLYDEFGNKWSKIAAALQGRTENQVKNRYYSGVRKGKSIKKPDSDKSLKITEMDSKVEHSLTSNAETISNFESLQGMIKHEEFETSDLVSEPLIEKSRKNAQSVPQNQIQVSGTKRTSFQLQEDQLTKKHQASYIQGFEEKLNGPFKKVKNENSNKEVAVNVKQEML